MANNTQKEYLLKAASIGLLAGFINGFFGSGGGLAVVPLSEKLLGLDMKKCLATSVFCMFFISAAGAAMYFVKQDMEPKPFMPYLIGGLAGGVIGGIIMRKVKILWLRRLFAALLFVAAVRQVFF